MVRFFLVIFSLTVSFAMGEAPSIKLQTIFTGGEPVYPGQEFYVGYLYSFNASIDLTEEKLPLLDLEGFKKLGDRQVEEKQEGNISKLQVVQKFQALNPGEFTVPGASATGAAYTLSAGNKKYLEPLLKTTTPELIITVSPFPKQGKPASFNGSIGDFKVSSHLNSPSSVSVGDRLVLSIQVEGAGEMQTVLLPDLCCQPGFSGFFQKGNFPTSSKVEEGKKLFSLELTVENPDAKEIPPIEWSSFDTKKKKYVKSQTAAIPIQVNHLPPPPLPPSSYEDRPFTEKSWRKDIYLPFAPSFLEPFPFFLWAAFGVLFMMFSLKWHKEELEKEQLKTSKKLFQKAQRLQGDEALKLLEEALELKLKEGTVRKEESENLLQEIYQERFSLDVSLDVPTLMTKGKQIFEL